MTVGVSVWVTVITGVALVYSSPVEGVQPFQTPSLLTAMRCSAVQLYSSAG